MTTVTIITEREDGSVAITRGPWTLDWEHIGEGKDGDHDPEDQDDTRLLRASLSYNGRPCEKGSYCTQAPAGTRLHYLLWATVELIDQLKVELNGQTDEVRFNHRAMELWTWRRYPKPFIRKSA